MTHPQNTEIPVTARNLPQPATFEEVLARLDDWYRDYLPAVHATLRPGATDAELDAFEERTGLKLPPDFRALYRWHDGQNWSVGGVLGPDFQPLSTVESQWTTWREIADDEELAMNVHIYTASHPTGAIREQYAESGWLPFLADGGGNGVALDLHPDVAGRVGQIITMGRDEEHRYVLAHSTEEFLRTFLARLESGQVKVRKLGGYDREMWSARLTDAQGQGEEGYYGLESLYPGFGTSPPVLRPPAVPKLLDMEGVLTRLDTWLGQHHPDLLAGLGSGATPAELAAAEAKLGRALPDEAKAMYRRHRDWGQVFGPRFVALERVAHLDHTTFGEPDAPGMVRPYSPTAPASGPADWVPLWQDNHGDFIGLNTAHYGEVHTFGPHARPRLVLGNGLIRLLDRFVRFAEAGLLRREGQRLLMPDATGSYAVGRIEGYFPSSGLSPVVR